MIYTIREIEKKDNKDVENVIRTCLIEYGANHEGTAWADPDLGRFSEIYNKEAHKYWVAIDENGKLVGVNAVIDKDNASSLLAAELGADHLVILTGVEKVAINWGKPNHEWLSDLTVEQAKEYIAQEQFAKGSMLPKVEAAVRFAESGEGRHALITLLEKAAEGIAGETGTVIHS